MGLIFIDIFKTQINLELADGPEKRMRRPFKISLIVLGVTHFD